MHEGIFLSSLSERKELQAEIGATILPLQDLCYATYTTPTGERIIVDLIAHDQKETIALLSYRDPVSEWRGLHVAYRDQSGAPDTWMWTEAQLEAARKNPIRINDAENDFREDEEANTPIQVAPIHQDRRTEILMLGLYLGKSDDEVRAQLQTEGFETALPAGYRETWVPEQLERRAPEPLQRPRSAKPTIKFSGKRRRR